MSNILIIKHGSLGDLIQANGAIEDIKAANPESKIILLTSLHYQNLMQKCPFVDDVLIDSRKPRWNLLYLFHLKKKLSNYNFIKVFDLQNSKRTNFYRKYLLKSQWSSTQTSLESGQKKIDFDKDPVIERMKVQLKKSGVKIINTGKSNLNWSFVNIRHITKNYLDGKYILIFPFCSPRLIKKKWPYYSVLISHLKSKYGSKYEILIAPGPTEIDQAESLNAKIILDEGKALKIDQLISLIKGASFIISNDTGPAHISSHLNKNGLVLFGSHTSSHKVSIETENFKAINMNNLNNLKTEDLMDEIKKKLN